ncbi:glycosyltransferase [Candidatus Cloacimonadota bacterium]
MNEIKVSVLINTYNRAQLISIAIQSALNQSYDNLEIIVVDGNSKDNTKEVVLGFQDERIRYIHSESSRVVDCINLGLAECTGKYIALLDDDDEWIPDKTTVQMSYFEQLDDSYGWIGCGETYIDDALVKETRTSMPTLRGNILLQLLGGSGNGVSGGTTLMFRKAAIDDLDGFIDIEYSTDFLFYLKLSRRYKFDFVPEYLCLTHENHIYESQRGSRLPDNRESVKLRIGWNRYILEEYADVFKEHPGLAYNYLSWLANNYSQINDKRCSWKYYYQAIKSRPLAFEDNAKLAVRLLRKFVVTKD